jgi:hypothetical protein
MPPRSSPSPVILFGGIVRLEAPAAYHGRDVNSALSDCRFEYRGPVSRSEFEEAWGEALRTFAGRATGAESKGVRHLRTYGTGWGGYALIEVDDAEAFGRYQAHHNQTYGRIAHISWEPLFDLDRTFEATIRDLKGETGQKKRP